MKTIIKKCLNCYEDFNAKVKEINRGYGTFCGLTCSARYNGKKRHDKLKTNTRCSWCTKEFYRSKSSKSKSKSGLLFCSRSCKDVAQRLEGMREIHPPHYGTGTGERGYRTKAAKAYPWKCEICGFKKYPEILEIHHINKDRTDNNIENLIILCPNHHAMVTRKIWKLENRTLVVV